jgi:hypothetical protein
VWNIQNDHLSDHRYAGAPHDGFSAYLWPNDDSCANDTTHGFIYDHIGAARALR